MKDIASFTVDHTRLKPGIYVSRKDQAGNEVITTFDLRFVHVNKIPVMDMPAVHTIEHLGAAWLRNSKWQDQIIYFGPMGCRTGFYLIETGDLESADVYEQLIEMCDWILDFEGDIPGATKESCGNWQEQNLDMAKFYIRAWKKELEENRRFVYPS